MRSNSFSEARKSLLILSVIFFICILFFLVASMFTSMGYKAYHSSAEVDNRYQHTVIIDPGHGGEDPGAFCNEALLEKDINLKISLYLSSYLQEFGYTAVLTRNEDKLLYTKDIKGTRKQQDLYNRAQFAKQFPDNSCFVSIHMNKFPAEACRGLQSFYSANNNNSNKLALSIQESASLLQTYNKRKIKDGTDTIFLLENINIPAVLVECGFLSNISEADSFADDEYKMKLAFSLFCGIAEFMEENYES